jgi:group I intron endonuclease
MEEAICGIYLVVNKINNKVYVGSSNNIQQRWEQHRQMLNSEIRNHHSDHLKLAWKKYGPENFEFKVLLALQNEKYLFFYEQFWINIFSSLNSKFGYNSREAGPKGKLSRETRQKIRKARLGKHHTEKTIQLISKNRKGKGAGRHLSEENRQKIKLANSGENNYRTNFTWKIINEIREASQDKKISHRKLSQKYNVATSTIQAIVENRTWRNSNYIPLSRKTAEERPNAKLLNSQAKEARELYVKEGTKVLELANKYKISLGTMSLVLQNKTYHDPNYTYVPRRKPKSKKNS